MSHIPVLFDETIDGLDLDSYDGPRVVVDATLGLAGHACGVYQKLRSTDTFIGFDAYLKNFTTASEKLHTLQQSDVSSAQLVCIHSNFSELKSALENRGITSISHLYADLGVSSVHFDDSESTFSYRHDAPLDMRFDPQTTAKSAADVIAELEFAKMAEMFRVYGDEKDAGRIARAIVHDRDIEPFTTTGQLAGLIERVTHSKKSVARCFQALRIQVNDEFGVLETLLTDALSLLTPGGRIAVISFHSGEDRIVKHIFREACEDERDALTGQSTRRSEFELITKKPILPSTQEVEKNPRSRSAKLRIITRKKTSSSHA